MAGIILTDEQQIPGSVAFKTKKGKPARIDGVPTFSVTNPEVLELTVDPTDPNKFTLKALDLGDCTFQMTADVDLGDGVKNITGSQDFTVVASEANTAVFTFGTPEDQPE